MPVGFGIEHRPRRQPAAVGIAGGGELHPVAAHRGGERRVRVGVVADRGEAERALAAFLSPGQRWIHELNTALDAETERALVIRATNYLEQATGSRPVGYRAPSWNFSPNTLDIIRGLGFLYDSSLMADDRPNEIMQNGEPTGLVELPVEWILDDAPLMNPRGNSYTPPRELLQVYIDEFDKAYEEGTMFLLTTHPHIIGHRSRVVILEELIDHIMAKGNVWFATHEQVARYVKEQAGL